MGSTTTSPPEVTQGTSILANAALNRSPKNHSHGIQFLKMTSLLELCCNADFQEKGITFQAWHLRNLLLLFYKQVYTSTCSQVLMQPKL